MSNEWLERPASRMYECPNMETHADAPRPWYLNVIPEVGPDKAEGYECSVCKTVFVIGPTVWRFV